MPTDDLHAAAHVADVVCDATDLYVTFVDGRHISVPLRWYPRLLAATPHQRASWELAGAGYGIHWPEIDEDLSAEGMLLGRAAPGVVT